MATLIVVATPIGNLEDLSPRAARVLTETPVIAAESVQRTRKLLTHLGIKGRKIISCREANRKRAAAQVRDVLDGGRDVALVSDAGTPGVSDPGGFIVKALADSGHRISPLPGPSALAAALSVSGLPGAPVIFLGFLPVKSGPRQKLLVRAGESGWPLVIYEAPHRLAATARDLLAVLGERVVVFARELSKLHEEVSHTTLSQLVAQAAEGGARGEITLVIAGGEISGPDHGEVDRLLAEGLSLGAEAPSTLAKRVAGVTGMGREEVYRRLLALKESAQKAD